MRITVVGTGYVGLTSGACLAQIGHDVTCIDSDEEKIRVLNEGRIPIFEPGLDAIVQAGTAAGRLRFGTEIGPAVQTAQVIFIAVGTPPRETGEPDLSYVERVAVDIGQNLNDYKVVVEKSTVPVKTGSWIKKTIERFNRQKVPFDVASNPEFLREGSAVEDFLKPDRIVIGVETERARQILEEVYAPLGATVVVTDIQSAELIKHASNSFLATKISFINAIAQICERAGADIKLVARGMGLDRRIGPAFLEAGAGFGGFCFPKDLKAFIAIARELGYDFRLLTEVERINEEQKQSVVRKVRDALWNLRAKRIGVLGLAFKPNTDDMRFAPAIDIVGMLVREGAVVRAYDPQAMERARAVLPPIEYAADPYAAAQDADALLILTEWDEFRRLDLIQLRQAMRHPIIVDGRNIFEPAAMTGLGFTYQGVGR